MTNNLLARRSSSICRFMDVSWPRRSSPIRLVSSDRSALPASALAQFQSGQYRAVLAVNLDSATRLPPSLEDFLSVKHAGWSLLRHRDFRNEVVGYLLRAINRKFDNVAVYAIWEL